MKNLHLQVGNGIRNRRNETREDGTSRSLGKNAGRCSLVIKEGISDARCNSDIFLAQDAEHSTQVFPRTRRAGELLQETRIITEALAK